MRRGGCYDTYKRSQRRGDLVAHGSAPNLSGTFFFSSLPLSLSPVRVCAMRGWVGQRRGNFVISSAVAAA